MDVKASLIRKYQLAPHPEGGFYRRIYTSAKGLSTASGERPTMSAIYYLLGLGEFSAWHRIRSDELWHFHGGLDAWIYQINPRGELHAYRLGHDGGYVHVVPANTWFAAELIPKSSEKAQNLDYMLCSCTVSPGFDFSDFELGHREELSNLYPQHLEIICRLSK